MHHKHCISNIFLIFLTFFDSYRTFISADSQQQQQQQNVFGDNNEVITTINPLIIYSTTTTTTTKTTKDNPQRILPKWLSICDLNIIAQINGQHQHQQQQQQQQHSNSNRSKIFISHVILKNLSLSTIINQNQSSNNITVNDCIDGKTYWNQRTGHCHECLSKCPSGAIILRQCNRTNNMECVCTQGWYMSILDGTCKPCSECPSGYGVWRTCRWSRNTVCRQCQPGTFSGASVGTLGCIKCSKCGPNQEMISGCDGNRDTICIDRSALMDSYLNTIDDGQQPSETDDLAIYSNGNTIDGSSSSLSSSSSSTTNFDRIRNHTNGVHLLPLYISMLVIIVFTFCIYALIQLKCNNSLMLRVDHQRVNDSSSIHTHHGHHTKLLPPPPPPPPPYNANNNILTSSIQTCPQHQYSYNIPAWLSSQTTDISPYQSPLPHYHHHNSVMPLFSALNQKESTQRKFHIHNNNNNRSTPLTTTNHYGQKTYNELLIGSNSPTSTTSTSNGSIQSVPLISDDVEHLTIEIRQALENMLGKDTEIWRLLARELGYDEKHIVQFESKATTITNGLKMIDTFKAIRLLLLDWSSQMTTSPDDHHHQQQQQQQSTETEIAGPPSLATLSNALIRIGRVDCARVVVRQNYHQQQRQRQQQQNHTSTSRQ
ncbi:hypothetical protein DERF_007746 [Dermatophagoides farinae]|uniref:Uncharacterized protein n=1 Tax=Dermatophagoides farinae TaxID=6954 RepID=A0A922L3Y5_DERFA|nr:hypothetical protein DERF_007746 [Dermatophagoides farinae]